MINIYQFERKIKEKIDSDRNQDKDNKWKAKYNGNFVHIHDHKEEREEMIQKYKKRILHFIDHVAKKPPEKGDEYSKRLEVAEKSFYRSKILGDESIRYTHKFETARVKVKLNQTYQRIIQEIEEKNKTLVDTVPNYILDTGDPLKLRQREPTKEIVPPYRQTARGSMERLYDSMVDKGLSNNHDKIAEKSFKKNMFMHKVDPAKFMNKSNGTSSLTPRKFLPELHDKSHFKAAYTLMLNSQSCLQNKYAKKIFQDEQLKVQTSPDRSKNISLSRFNNEISMMYGIPKPNRYRSQMQLQRSDASFNDRATVNNSLMSLINDIDHPQQEQSTLNQSIINKSTLKRNISQKQMSNIDIDDPLEQLINSYRKNGDKTQDDYLNYEYNEFGEKKILNPSKSQQKIQLTHHEELKQKSEFERIQNQTKKMIEVSNYTRKKHFKSNTLRYGEGSLFMNKGASNKDYEMSILKKSLS